jgi:hypothetical protein
MIIEYEFMDRSLATLEYDTVKFWKGYGLPDFQGTLVEFNERYPEYFKQLMDAEVIKQV